MRVRKREDLGKSKKNIISLVYNLVCDLWKI